MDSIGYEHTQSHNEPLIDHVSLNVPIHITYTMRIGPKMIMPEVDNPKGFKKPKSYQLGKGCLW